MVFFWWYISPQEIGMQKHLLKKCGDDGAPDLA